MYVQFPIDLSIRYDVFCILFLTITSLLDPGVQAMVEGRARFWGGGGGIKAECVGEILPAVSFPSAKP